MNDQVTLSKALALCRNAHERLERIDSSKFPTEATGKARDMLSRVFELLVKSPSHATIVKPVLLKVVIQLQEYVGLVEKSSTDHISWPIVENCELLWRQLFGSSDCCSFYSVTDVHNYGVLKLTEAVKDLVGNGILLSDAECNEAFGSLKIHCVELASAEDQNWTLYANIGHEFGHVLWAMHKGSIHTIFDNNCSGFLNGCYQHLVTHYPAKVNTYFPLLCQALLKIAEELFSDLVGFRVMGPTFFLSLFEMSWDKDQNGRPDRFDIVYHWLKENSLAAAYPSLRFRLYCIEQMRELVDFRSDARKSLRGLKNRELHESWKWFTVGHDGLANDPVFVFVRSSEATDALKQLIEMKQLELKQALLKYMHDSASWFTSTFADGSTSTCAIDVSHLIDRLDHRVLPNIVRYNPSKDFLGEPANFSAILASSALYRMYLLNNTVSDAGSVDLPKELAIMQRLVAKALEVAFVQRNYKRNEGEALGNS